jgi:hypothetical protein
MTIYMYVWIWDNIIEMVLYIHLDTTRLPDLSILQGGLRLYTAATHRAAAAGEVSASPLSHVSMTCERV